MRRPDGNDTLVKEGEDALLARADAAEPFIPDQDDPEFQKAAQAGADSWQRPLDEPRPSLIDEMASRIRLSAYQCRDPKALAPRRWIYGTHLIRRFVSAVVAAGAVGKTSLKMAEALAMITGKPLLGVRTPRPMNVFIWNGEDPHEELERRFEATRQHYGITPEDIEGSLYLHSGRDMEIKTAISVRGGRGFEIARPVTDALAAQFREHSIDVAIIDPFVSSHAVSENDNAQIDGVVKAWGRIAEECDCAVDLIHHLRKAGGGERTIEDARGAIALIAAARDAQLLLKADREELAAIGIDEADAWRFFRIADGKANMAPPASTAEFYRLESVELGNGGPHGKGDSVGVVTRWTKPGLFDDVPISAIDTLMRTIRQGGWRADQQAKLWVGLAVAEALNIDLDTAGGKARVRRMITEWVKSGVLRTEQALNEKREMKLFIVLGDWRFSTPEWSGEDENVG